MREFTAVAKALAEENRARVLTFLRDGELCVCQIIELLGLTPSTVSKHLAILYRAGLIESRKDGRWIFYRLAGADGSAYAQTAIQWVLDSLKDTPRSREDAKRVKVVRKMDIKELCRHYDKCSDEAGSRPALARRVARQDEILTYGRRTC